MKRMRRLRASTLVDFTSGRRTVYEHTSHKGHYGKEMRDRRRRGYLAKLARRKNRTTKR